MGRQPLIGFVLRIRVPWGRLRSRMLGPASLPASAAAKRRVVRELGSRLTQARLRPQCRGDAIRVDAEPAPPCGFIASAVDLAMVSAAERHRELVAHFATERPRLRRPKMMGIRGLTAADKAGLRGHEPKVRLCHGCAEVR